MSASHSRGQVALEYLLTYAWALVIVVGVVAILYSLGWLDPLAMPAYSATGFTSLAVPAFAALDNGTVLVQMRNDLEYPVTVLNVTVDDVAVSSNLPQTIASGGLANLSLSSNFGSANTRYTKRLRFAFTLTGSNITHYEAGQLSDYVYAH